MKTPQPRFWKTLERHPLSAEYRDISGPAWMRFTLLLKRVGFLKERPIVLHDKKVLDGWQRLRACIELNIVPVFVGLPKGISPEDYVQAVNDERRHETPAEIEARISERVKRVAEKRVEGKSTRTIAEEEGVSQTTVLSDIDKSTEQGCSVEPPDGKVTGKDDKKRDASKPKIRCAKCARMWPNSEETVKDCPQCAQARHDANGKAEKKPKAGQPKFDEKKFDQAYGGLVRVIDQRGNAMGKGAHHRNLQELMSKVIKEYQLWKKETA